MRRLSRIAIALTLLLASGSLPARAFELHRHSVMTYQVLTRHGVGGVAASLIALGALLPDVQDCIPSCYCDFAPSFCQPDPPQALPHAVNHFDNNLLDESIYRVNERMADARSGIVPTPGDSRAAGRALLAFGKALHTTQDFYAHSTFLEINIFPMVIQFNLDNAPLWYGEPYALYSWHHGSLSGDGSLQTGFYLQGKPAGGYTHDELNKDSQGSSEGHQPLTIVGHGSSTMYAAVSGDFSGSMSFADAGLAPRHTLYAYQALLNGGDVFPYVFAPASAAHRVDPAHAQAVLDFFSWVEQDSTLHAMAVAADSIMAHADGDSIGSFPMSSLDADGLPIPPTLSVAPEPETSAPLMGVASPNPFGGRTEIGFVAPRSGPVKAVVYDAEGRRVALLFAGEVGAGLHSIAWDGRDDGGHLAPAGVYLVRLTGFGRSESRRVALTR